MTRYNDEKFTKRNLKKNQGYIQTLLSMYLFNAEEAQEDCSHIYYYQCVYVCVTSMSTDTGVQVKG